MRQNKLHCRIHKHAVYIYIYIYIYNRNQTSLDEWTVDCSIDPRLH